MNNFVEESSARTVSVFRGSAELKSGDTFQPGEMLRVHLSDGTPQYVLEVKNGYFPGGGCHGRRIHGKNDVDVMMPLDHEAKNPVSIVAGWAPGHSTVGISAPFILNPEAAAASPDTLTLPAHEAANGSNATAADIHTSAQIKVTDAKPADGSHRAEKIDVIKVPKIDISSTGNSDESGRQNDAISVHIDHHHDSGEDPSAHIRPPPPGLGREELAEFMQKDLKGHIRPPPGLGREELAEFMHQQQKDLKGYIRPPGLGREELAEYKDPNGHIRPPPPGLGPEELAEFMQQQQKDLKGYIRPPPPGLGREELAEFMQHQHEDFKGHIRPPPGLGREELAEFKDPSGHIRPPPGLGPEELAEFMQHQHEDFNGHIRPPPPGLGREELAEYMRHQHEDPNGHIRPPPPGLGLEHLAERMRRNDHQHHDLTSAHQPPPFKFNFQNHVHPTSPPLPAHNFIHHPDMHQPNKHPDMHSKDLGKGQGGASVFSHDSNPNRLAESPLTLAAEVLLILAAVLLLYYGWKFRFRWLRVASRCGKSRVTAE
eukprot:gene29342-38421_t